MHSTGPYLTPLAVAARWSVSRRTVERMVARGELRGVRVGGQWRIVASSVEDYERANTWPRKGRAA